MASIQNDFFEQSHAQLNAFVARWKDVVKIMNAECETITSEQVRQLLHLLESLFLLLAEEEPPGDGEHHHGPILSYLMSSTLLQDLLEWLAKMESWNSPYSARLRGDILRLFELLVSQSKQQVLHCKHVLRPLLRLLSSCTKNKRQTENNTDVERQMMLLLNQLCFNISIDTSLLESFFHAGEQEQGPARFLIFSLLIPYVHREGLVGQHARDSLLLIMSLSSVRDEIGTYIAKQTDFCPVLATGLSGLYSELPRQLNTQSENWCRLMKRDVARIPALMQFINSLEFCNAVVQVAHPLIRSQLLSYVYNGFLLPVLGPALQQDAIPNRMSESRLVVSSADEIVTATAYLELSLRTVSEPSLLEVFLKFTLNEKIDGMPILDTLIQRISATNKLSTVSLSLFYTMIRLYNQDVMEHLVFRYLDSFDFVSPRCRHTLATVFDARGPTAARSLLSLVRYALPNDSLDDSVKYEGLSRFFIGAGMQNGKMHDSLESELIGDSNPVQAAVLCYNRYLKEAHENISLCWNACCKWKHRDSHGGTGVTDAAKDVSTLLELSPCNDKVPSAKCNLEAIHQFLDSFDTQEDGDGDGDDGAHPSATMTTTMKMATCFEEMERILQEIDVCDDDWLHYESMQDCTHSFRSNHEEDDEEEEREDEWHVVREERRGSIEMTSTPNKSKKDTHGVSADSVYVTASDTSTTDLSDANSPTALGCRDYIGAFLDSVLTALGNLTDNSPTNNYLLTGIISSLCFYAHASLRTFLLDVTLELRPTVRSLWQVVSSLHAQIESHSATIPQFQQMYTAVRVGTAVSGLKPDVIETRTKRSVSMSAFEQNPKSRPTKLSFFKRLTLRKPPKEQELLSEEGGYRYIHRSPSIVGEEPSVETNSKSKLVESVVIFEEFIQELAALCQEHTTFRPDAKLKCI